MLNFEFRIGEGIAHVTAFPGRAHARKGREAPTPVGVETQKGNRDSGIKGGGEGGVGLTAGGGGLEWSDENGSRGE